MVRVSRKFQRWGGVVIAVAIAGSLSPLTSASAAVPVTWVDEQTSFILSQQLDSGAILSVGGTKITPYFANIAALGLIKAGTPASLSGAQKWMKWYLGHLNTSTTSVPANSVFDYTYDPGTRTETPTGDFDSVDSYASTTLNLAYAAYTSGDPALQAYVAENIVTYEAIANILNYGGPTGVRIQTGADAGLTIAKPSYPIAYTMDNAEVYSGLAEFAQLESILGRSSEATLYAAWATSTKDTIVSKLWNPTNQNWDWAYGNESDTNVFYAQAIAQLWPTLYGVVAPNDPKAISAWNQFSASYPTWYDGTLPDGYPWVSISRVAQMMGETAHADAYLTNVHSRYAPGFGLPTSCGVAVCGRWYDNEAGWFILASLASNASTVQPTSKRDSRLCRSGGVPGVGTGLAHARERACKS